MRPIWIMAGLAGVVRGASTLRRPRSLRHTSIQASRLPDWTRTMVCRIRHAGSGLASKSHGGETARCSPNSFTGLSTVARPETQPSDVPNFFQASPGVASSDAQTSDVPNFFQATPDSDSPKVAKAQSAYSTMDTPLFTTTNESPRAATQHPMTPRSGDAPAADGEGRADSGAGEGNRTLVCSLGSCRSTIELHPRGRSFTRFSPSMQFGRRLCSGKQIWWRGFE